MKRCFLFLVFLFPAVSQADWAYVGVQNYQGYYYYTNGVVNDGWYYYARPVCHHGCTSYEYVKYGPIKAAYVEPEKPAVRYSPSWKSDLVKALDRKTDTEQFAAILRESGLSSGEAPARSYATSGLSTYSQGFYADQGSTAYGRLSGSYAPQIDVADLLRQQQRLQERWADIGGSANTHITNHIGQLGAVQLEVEKIKATSAGYAAAIAAAQPPRTESHVWQSNPPAAQGAAPAAQSRRTPALDRLRAEATQEQAAQIMDNSCIRCHSGANPKGKLNLEIQIEDAAERSALYDSILERVFRQDPDKIMPPPKGTKGNDAVPPLTPDEKAILKAARPNPGG